MKKTNNFEKDLESKLEQYFDNVEVPELSVEKQEELKNLVKKNSRKRKSLSLWKKLTVAASTICLIALLIIPTIVFINKNNTTPPTNPPVYYGKAEATKTPHTLEETQNIVNSLFPKYNFMFTDLTFYEATGFYNPTNNSLLALRILLDEPSAPFTRVDIHIVASKQFIFDDQLLYISQAEISQTENYKLYKKTHQEMLTEYERGYIIFEDHEIYINLDKINEELFNKFI